jgi:hypothetical protein
MNDANAATIPNSIKSIDTVSDHFPGKNKPIPKPNTIAARYGIFISPIKSGSTILVKNYREVK